MTEQMTLEKVRDWLKKPPKALENMYRGKSRKSYADEARGLAEIIDAHLNAAKGESVSQEPSNDREALVYLMDRFDTEEWECRCGHAESTKDMDSAIFLREYLRTRPDSPDVVRDAERYRWLRKHSVFANDSMHELWFDASLDRGETEQLDKQIDDAMSAREGGK